MVCGGGAAQGSGCARRLCSLPVSAQQQKISLPAGGLRLVVAGRRGRGGQAERGGEESEEERGEEERREEERERERAVGRDRRGERGNASDGANKCSQSQDVKRPSRRGPACQWTMGGRLIKLERVSLPPC